MKRRRAGTAPVNSAHVPDRQRATHEPRHDRALVDRIIDWVRDHYADDVTARHIGLALDRHPAYLGSVFHRFTGTSLKTYVTHLRMERAAELIEHGDKIEAVSVCVGYRSKATFYRHFRQHFGMTPRSYRDRSVRAPRD